MPVQRLVRHVLLERNVPILQVLGFKIAVPGSILLEGRPSVHLAPKDLHVHLITLTIGRNVTQVSTQLGNRWNAHRVKQDSKSES